MSAPFLFVQGLEKSFGAVRALRGANLTVGGGEIHGLVGENGAGKSTLIKILSGVYVQEGGVVEVGGEALVTGSVARSESLGICVVHQESTAFRDLGLAENLFVGHEPRRFFGLFLDKREMRRRAQEWMASIGQDASFTGTLSERSIAQQQLVAIARAIATNCRLLVLDEPTASLSVREVDTLKSVVRDLARKGVSVLYVTHRLEEVFDLCDRVTVMRDGETVATWNVGETSREQLIKAMVGREVGETRHAPRTAGKPRLSVEGLTKKGVFENVSFQVMAGEILGIGGLVGAGRSEVVKAIFGTDRADIGMVEVDGKRLKPGSVQDSTKAGIALVPEDRQHLGLVLPLPVSENLVMSVRGRIARFGWIAKKQEREAASKQKEELSIRTSSLGSPASSLSGGNQQKVVLGKWLATTPTVLIVDEPTRGVDVASKSEIHTLLRRRADEGAAVLLVSSDLPELLALSDRIVVMREGKIAGSLTRETATPETVLSLAIQEKK